MNWLKKIGLWFDDRSGIGKAVKKLMQHPVPPKSKWSYVFGSGVLFCFILQIVTGVALALMYQPTAGGAFDSLQYITNQALMGKLLRGIHYFGASAMILLVGIHMMRVYITASYKYPREMSWISGIFLLILTMAMGFTGQLLRWDDDGVWSAVVGAEQMGRIPFIGKTVAHLLIGGDTIGGHSLGRFFDYHVFIFPALIFLFVGFHLWLVLRNGISEPPKIGRPVDAKTYRAWYKDLLERKGVPFFPNAAWRDVVFSVAVIFIIVLLAVCIGPKALKNPPDPSQVYTSPRPDWYLLWIYSLFALLPPKFENYAIFFGPLLVFALLLALPFLSNKGERHALRRPWAIVGVVTVVVMITCLLVIGYKAPWSPDFKAKPLNAATVHSSDTMVMAGAQLFYTRRCMYCHKIEKQGGISGPDLTHVMRRMNEAEIKLRIINGSEKMPAYGSVLTKEELEKLLAFLKTRE